MFDKRVYMTAVFAHEVPGCVRFLIKMLMMQLKSTASEIDSFQVFKVTSKPTQDRFEITVTHHQELGDYKARMSVVTESCFEGTIYFINSIDENNEEYSTLLLSSEY